MTPFLLFKHDSHNAIFYLTNKKREANNSVISENAVQLTSGNGSPKITNKTLLTNLKRN